VELTEPVGIPRILVVGVKTLRQKPEHAMNRVGIGVRTDLKELVTVEVLFFRHNGILGSFGVIHYPGGDAPASR
jgi:hypothetical protein